MAWHLGKQAIVSTCKGSRAGLLKISVCLAQPCGLWCLDVGDRDAPLLTTLGCNSDSSNI